jgi:hypothetical protein
MKLAESLNPKYREFVTKERSSSSGYVCVCCGEGGVGRVERQEWREAGTV